jgi:hypothetical protein
MSTGEKPRFEPEIIPPGQPDSRSAGRRSGMRVFVDAREAHRVYVARLGPLGIIVLLLGIAILSGILIVLLAGVFLIWFPIMVLVIAAGILSSRLFGYFGRID